MIWENVHGRGRGFRKRLNLAAQNAPGSEICFCNEFPRGRYLVWLVRVKG